jgi:hypothetical protein
MQRKIEITQEVQEQVIQIINEFNKKNFRNKNYAYIAEFKKDILNLKRKENDLVSPIARLKYTGKMDDWQFGIFKWSTERYDFDEFMFPGSEFLDGTIEGALKAGNKAYPI